MKYLKTFEKQTEEDRLMASIEGDKNSEYIQSLIDEYMAYVIDDGYKVLSNYVYYDRKEKGDYYYIKIFKGAPFDIEDIYDDVLSFIEVLEIKGYNLTDCEVSLAGMKAGEDYVYTRNYIMDRKIDNFQIRYIYFNFRKNKPT